MRRLWLNTAIRSGSATDRAREMFRHDTCLSPMKSVAKMVESGERSRHANGEIVDVAFIEERTG